MDIQAKKLELLEWLLHINDLSIIKLIDKLKQTSTKTVQKLQYTQPEYGCLKGQIEMSDDFDDPIEDFKEYM